MSDSAARELRLTAVVYPEDLKQFKHHGFNLCVTRHVRYDGMEKQGNVILSAVPSQRLARSNLFTLLERYQIYGLSRGFQAGAQVIPQTRKVPVQAGQKVTLTRDGEVIVSGPPHPGEPIQVTNERSSGSFGLENFNSNTGEFHTMFISPIIPINTTIPISPIKKLSVFWSMYTETDTMIDHTGTPPFHVDLTEEDKATLEYKAGTWTVV